MAAVTHERRHSRKLSLPTSASIIARFTPRKRDVSPPFSPRLRHSRIPSRSSIDHISADNVTLTTSEMEERATALTKALLTDQGWDGAAKYLTAELTKRLESPCNRQHHLGSGNGQHHNCESNSRDARDRESLFTLKDAAVDETQRKVWIVAERAKHENRATQWVEMMSFDHEGKVCEIEGWGRPVRLDAD